MTAMTNNHTEKAGPTGLEPATLALQDEMKSGEMRLLKSLEAAGMMVEARAGRDALWLLVRTEGMGGLALRTAYSAGSPCIMELGKHDDQSAQFSVSTALGEFHIHAVLPDADRPLLHWTVSLTPREDLHLPFWPRDLYPLDEQGSPTSTEGIVHAAQRGLNTGILYLTLAKPQFGSALYLQNWTALNDFFQATETIPDGCVGGEWPELGYRPPVSERPLPKGKKRFSPMPFCSGRKLFLETRDSPRGYFWT